MGSPQEFNIEAVGSSSSSTTAQKLDLSTLGTMGPATASVLELQEEADLGLALVDKEEYVHFREFNRYHFDFRDRYGNDLAKLSNILKSRT